MVPAMTPSTEPILSKIRTIYSQEAIATALGRVIRTIRRWEKGEIPIPKMAIAALNQMLLGNQGAPNEDSKHGRFTFIDLFAGIGGTRLGFESAGGKCVFTSEWDKYACQTYRDNHSDGHPIAGDIRLVNAADIPDHDILVAGFPCQPFSLAGVSKKNSLGRAHGFDDPTQGTLFFEIKRILKEKRPRAFLLENVKNLRSHDKGNTFKIIIKALREDLGYIVPEPRIIDAAAFVPQHRERIFIAGCREDCGFDWTMLRLPNADMRPTLESILHRADETTELPYTVSKKAKTHVADKYTLSDHLWEYLQAYAKKHRELGHGFGCSVFDPEDIARTLSARYHKDGSEILIRQPRKNPRRLTPRECCRLMGFPNSFQIKVSDTQAYKQFGNSVVVPVIAEIAKLMADCIDGSVPVADFNDAAQLKIPDLVA